MTEETIFAEALEKQTPAERSAFLDGACGADASLRQRIEVLIACHERAVEFLEKPAVEQIAAGIAQAKHDAAATDAIRPAEEGISETPVHTRFGETQAEPEHEDGQSLDFLAPSERSDALGRIGHYHVLSIIGRGGMGIVLKAFDEELQRVVAIKVMTQQVAATGTARKRFRREAQAAAAIRDEHIITIHAVQEVNGLPYLVMEYISGVSLQERLDQNGPLELKEILRIGMQTAAGLAKAHAQGLIHRDIKPANILLENGVQRVKITDFGLARAVDDTSLTQSGVIAGTPQYMAPEQACGEAVDHRADLFSLGSVLYAMCTGYPPFRASTVMAVLKRVCEDTPRPIRQINPEIPDWLCAIIDKLHAKDPAQRFQTASEVAELLGQYLAHLQQPMLVPLPPQTDRPDATAAITVRRSALRSSVLMILTPVLLIPAVGAILLLSGALPGVLVGACVAAYLSVAFAGVFLFIVLPATRRERVRTASKPPPVECPAEWRAMARAFRLRLHRRAFIPALILLLLGIAVAAWPWFGPHLLGFLTHSAILEVHTVSDDEFEDLRVIFRGVTVIGRDGVTRIDAGSWAYLKPGLYEFRPEGSWRGPLDHYEMVVSPPNLLLTAGERYSVKLSLRRKPTKEPTPPQFKPERTPIAAKPFAICRRPNQPERLYATLAEAVGAAAAGDTIEVRGDGPFWLDAAGVTINRPLTIRAGAGCRPVFKLAQAQPGQGRNKHILDIWAPITLEGLDFDRTGEHEGTTRERAALYVQNGPLHMANCRLRTGGLAHYLVWLLYVHEVDIRNCLFAGPALRAISVAHCSDGDRLALTNCVFAGTSQALLFTNEQDKRASSLRVRLIGNTMNTVAVSWHHSSSRELQVEARDNVLAGPGVIDFLQFPSGKSGKELATAVRWEGKRNLYRADHPSIVIDGRPATGLGDLDTWKAATLRFQGGDDSGWQAAMQTSDYWRLALESAGKGAGEAARDLGADVDLVGPGAAYERWKKTPEYQQWLKDKK